MKLYYSKGTCSLAIRIVLHEIGKTCEYVAVNLKTKVTDSGKDYLKINPKAYVPALELDNGEVLTENSVIHQYLADQANRSDLLPTVGNLQRYRVLEWLNFVTTELHKGCSPLFNAKVPDSLKEEVFRPLLRSKLEFVNQHLAQNDYLLGNSYTLPDGYLFVVLSWLAKIKIDLAEFQNLFRYFEALKTRPSIQSALSEEG